MTNPYLDPKEAIKLMLEGEILTDGNDGYSVRFSAGTFEFKNDNNDWMPFTNFDSYDKFYRKPQKQERLMTKYECLLWAQSDAAKGWVVTENIYPFGRIDYKWRLPAYFTFSAEQTEKLKRAKLKPDGSGIDENTITDFTVEVEE